MSTFYKRLAEVFTLAPFLDYRGVFRWVSGSRRAVEGGEGTAEALVSLGLGFRV